MTTCVPLAALILDYPVAYVPVIPQQSPLTSPTFLAGVLVSTYECVLTYDPSPSAPQATVSVMKFSCPQVLEEACPERVSSQLIKKQLEGLFARRLRELGIEGSARVQVVHKRVSYDRLAL